MKKQKIKCVSRYLNECLNNKKSFPIYVISLLLIAIFFGDAIGNVNFRILGIVVTFYRVIVLSLFIVTVMYIYKTKMELPVYQIHILMFMIMWVFLSVIQFLVFIDLDKSEGLKEITYLLFGSLIILYFMIYIDNYENIKKLYKLVKYVGFLLIIGGIVEVITGVHWSISRYSDIKLIQEELVLWGSTEDAYRWISTGPFYNENDFSAALAILFPFFSYENTNIKMKIISCLGQMGGLILICLNNSIISLLSVILFFLIKIYIKSPSKLKVLEVIGGVVGGCIAILNLDNIVYSLQGSSLAIRLEVYNQSLNLCKRHILLGVGPGGFEDYFIKNPVSTGRVSIVNPHNYFFEIMTQYGIIILLGMLILLLWIFRKYWMKLQDYKEAEIFLEFWIIYVIISFAPSSFLDKGFSWLLIAIGISGIRGLNEEQVL